MTKNFKLFVKLLYIIPWSILSVGSGIEVLGDVFQKRRLPPDLWPLGAVIWGVNAVLAVLLIKSLRRWLTWPFANLWRLRIVILWLSAAGIALRALNPLETTEKKLIGHRIMVDVRPDYIATGIQVGLIIIGTGVLYWTLSVIENKRKE